MGSQNSLRSEIVTNIGPADWGNGSGLDAESAAKEVDTQGFRWARFIVNCGTLTGTSIVFQVEASDTAGSGHAAVSGATATITGAADDDSVTQFLVDTQNTGRYLILTHTVTAMTVSEIGVTCSLEEPSDSAFVATGPESVT
jgi:hypothetical protein